MSADAPTTMPTPVTRPAEVVRLVDPWMLGAAVFLVGLGVVVVYGASAIRSAESGLGEGHYLVRQLSAVALGVVALSLTRRIPVDAWSRLAYPLLILTLALLIAVWVPGVGRTANGAQRWIAVGGLSFQPSELAKMSVVLYLAHSLAKKREQVSTFSIGFVPHLVVVGLVAGLVLVQPDLGTALVIATTAGAMLFVAGTRIGYLAGGFVLLVPVVLHYIATRPHALDRMLAFLHPEAHRAGVGYQAWESLVAFGSGGVFGVGLGAGSNKLFFLPEGHTDFVFAVVGQELGFVGAAAVIVAFVILLGRSFGVARNLPCRFPMFLVFGIAIWLGLQAAMHVAVTLALLPTKGITLPFLSFGRSSMVVSLAALGIMLRASAEARLLRGRR